MKRACSAFLPALLFVAACASASVEPAWPVGRPLVSTVSLAVQVLTSDVAAVGRIEDAGPIGEFDVVMPLDDKPTRQRLQKLNIRMEKVLLGPSGPQAVPSNAVVTVLATVPAAVTNVAATEYRKDVQGIFLMKCLSGRSELLLPRHVMDKARLPVVEASTGGIAWGPVTSGLQMAVLQLSPAAVNTNTNNRAVRVGVAVRNASGGPVAVNRAQAGQRLAVAVDGNTATVMDGRTSFVVSTNAADTRAVVTLLPNQVVMLSPQGNADSGFSINLPSNQAWSVKAVCEPGRGKDDAPSWEGRLESGTITVKAFRPLVRPPWTVRQAVTFGQPTSKAADGRDVRPADAPPRPALPATTPVPAPVQK